MLQFMCLHSDPTKSAYENFKERFPIRETEQGVHYRQNKVLLNSLKAAPKWMRDCESMEQIRRRVLTKLRNQRTDATRLNVVGDGDNPILCYFSDKYIYDGMLHKPKTDDERVNEIRYIIDGRAYGCHASRFIAKLIKDHPDLYGMPQQIVTYIAEWFIAEWRAYTTNKVCNAYTLHIGSEEKDFEHIYSIDGTGSCMRRQGFHTYYLAVKGTRAAWMTDKDGETVARCVIFNAFDEDGKCYRYAERRYTKNGELSLKRILRDMLICAGEIDLYKADDASYDQIHEIYDLDGHRFEESLHVVLDQSILEQHDYVLSFQDTFVGLDEKNWIAYNDRDRDCDLNSTDGYIPGYEDYGKNWDDYHDEYTSSDVVDVIYRGRHMDCASDNLEDFVEIDGQWYHHCEDDVHYCSCCGEYFLYDEYSCYSDITEVYYCCRSCMDEEEELYKKRHWTYSEYDDEYYEDADEVVIVEDAYMDGETMRFERNTSVHIDSLSAFTLIQIGSHEYVNAESVHSCISAYIEQ